MKWGKSITGENYECGGTNLYQTHYCNEGGIIGKDLYGFHADIEEYVEEYKRKKREFCVHVLFIDMRVKPFVSEKNTKNFSSLKEAKAFCEHFYTNNMKTIIS